MRKRIYVAGPYSASSTLSVFNNIRNGIRASVKVLLAGYAPFCPWLDYQFILLLGPDEHIMIDDMYDYSLSWVEASHAVLVLPGWELSIGTRNEIAFAKERNIPIYYSLDELQAAERD